MTSDKTATERLRELLDERGVKYDTHGERYGTWYDTPLGGHVYVPENNAGYLHVRSDAMTPEQAIAATLGDADATRERHGDADVAAENAKLRELATKMARALGVGSDWCDRDCLAEFGCTDSCPIADAMHEMGIKEVRDD